MTNPTDTDWESAMDDVVTSGGLSKHPGVEILNPTDTGPAVEELIADLDGAMKDFPGRFSVSGETGRHLLSAFRRLSALEVELARKTEALEDVLENNDLTCMRANEEISAAEGCPCPNCRARAALSPLEEGK